MESHGYATLNVLTQRPLLALIASFQHGLPSVTGPLLLRYLAVCVQNDAPTAIANPSYFVILYDLWTTPNRLVSSFTREKPLITKAVVDADHAMLYSLLLTWRWDPSVVQQAHDVAVAFRRLDTLAWLEQQCGFRTHAPLPSTARFATPLAQRLLSPAKWRAQITVEAVALYDTESLDALRFLLRWCEFQPNAGRARARLVHRVWEAAAAFGRVDILIWLYETHHAVVASIPTLARVTATLASRHGHVSVLNWLEVTCGGQAVEGLRRTDATILARCPHTYDVLPVSCAGLSLQALRRCCYADKPLAHCGHTDVLTWMAQRSLGVVSIGAMRIALARQDFDMVRALVALVATANEDTYRLSLVQFAVFFQLLDAAAAHAGEPLESAIEVLYAALVRIDVSSIVYHLEDAIDSPAQWIVYLLLTSNDCCLLHMVAATNAAQARNTLTDLVTSDGGALQLLINATASSDVANVLMLHGIDKDTTGVETLLTLAGRRLSPTAVAFARRASTDTLGLVASLVGSLENLSIFEAIVSRLPHTSRDDARDTVLYVLLTAVYADVDLQRLFDAADANRSVFDAPFFALCRALRREVRAHENHEVVAFILRRRFC